MDQTQWQAGAAVWQASGLLCLKMLLIFFEKEKRRVGKNVLFAVRTVMHQEQVDTESGDFNGAAWRRKWCKDQRRDSTIEEAFANTNLPIPLGSTPLLGPVGVPGEWADACGFIKSVKEAEHIRVQELVKKIESHPHREALQADCSKRSSAIHSAKIRRR